MKRATIMLSIGLLIPGCRTQSRADQVSPFLIHPDPEGSIHCLRDGRDCSDTWLVDTLLEPDAVVQAMVETLTQTTAAGFITSHTSADKAYIRSARRCLVLIPGTHGWGTGIAIRRPS